MTSTLDELARAVAKHETVEDDDTSMIVSPQGFIDAMDAAGETEIAAKAIIGFRRHGFNDLRPTGRTAQTLARMGREYVIRVPAPGRGAPAGSAFAILREAHRFSKEFKLPEVPNT